MKITESGRSMVEMLGVLAIVGVLSIAGVGGYTVAMKKHRANEVMNEAAKRAVVLSMKLAAGQSIENGLDEFVNNTVGSVTFSAPLAQTDTFTMTLSGIDTDLCSQLQKASENTMMAFDANCEKAVFYKDLRRGIEASAAQDGGQGGQEGTPPVVDACNNSCNENQRCVGNSCMPLYITVGHYERDYDDWCSQIPCQSCDTGYHWATLSEVISEFPCELVSEGIYSCSGAKGVYSADFWIADGVPYDNGTIGIEDYVSVTDPILCRLDD